MARRWKIFTIIGVISLALDIATKVWANSALGSGASIDVIENFWSWRLSYNTGSAFGMFHSVNGARVFLTIVGIAALGFVFYMQHKARNDQTWVTVALGMIAGGAVGNLADRIIYGKVTDFVVWKYHDSEWPTFNVADVALCVGVGMLLLDSFRESRRESRLRADEPAGGKTPNKAGKAGKKRRKR